MTASAEIGGDTRCKGPLKNRYPRLHLILPRSLAPGTFAAMRFTANTSIRLGGIVAIAKSR